MNNSLFFAILLGSILMAHLASGQNDTCPKKPEYKKDPNAYPSVNQGRYQFMRYYYPVLGFIRDCYFSLVNAVFGLYNAFQPIKTVQTQNMSQLLLYPARKAAKKIRNLEVNYIKLNK